WTRGGPRKIGGPSKLGPDTGSRCVSRVGATERTRRGRACSAQHSDRRGRSETTAPGSGADQAVRIKRQRVPLHAGTGVSDALRGPVRPPRQARVSAGRGAYRLLPRRAVWRSEARYSRRGG